jgi:hypothetical protein
MFYGWGTKSKEFTAPDGRVLACFYDYVSLMFIFTFVWRKKWKRMSPDGRGIEIAKDDVEQLFFPEKPPSIGIWTQYSLAFFLATIVAVLAYGSWTTRDSSLVTALGPGDCFVDTAEVGEVERLETPDCSEPHDSQFTAAFALTGAPDELPEVFDPYWGTVAEQCSEASGNVLVRIDSIPDDAYINFYSPSDDAWEDGDREVLCYLHAPNGLEGSFVQLDS